MAWPVVLVFLAGVCGYHTWFPRIPNADRVFSNGGAWPGVGHQTRGGGGPRNPFGVDFLQQNKTWTVYLCQLDSDGDGRTNGYELGDENCTWRHNNSAPYDPTGLRLTHITNPGIEDDPFDTCQSGPEISELRCSHPTAPGSTIQNVTLPGYLVPGGNATDKHEMHFFQCVFRQISSDAVRHAVRFDPIIQSVSDAPIHHMKLYSCEQAPSLPLDTLFDCDDGMVAGCTQLVWAWTLGGKSTCLPAEVGFKMGGSTPTPSSTPYFLLQNHYFRENKFYYTKIDSSGVNITFSPTLQTYDAGILQVGPANSSSIQIPPGQTTYSVHDQCPSSCTARLNGDGIRIFAYTTHAHRIGSKMILEHRNSSGYTLDTIVWDPYWSVRHPETVSTKQRLISPSHSLNFECGFNSNNQTTMTTGGLSYSSEMCAGYLMYYPYVSDTFNKNCKSDSQSVNVCATMARTNTLPIGFSPNETYSECPFVEIARDCQNDTDCFSGTCPYGRCVCFNGYTGVLCEVQPEFSFSSPAVEDGEFVFSAIIDSSIALVFSWNVESLPDGSVVLTAALETSGRGWVSLGIGKNMQHADIAMISVSSSGAVQNRDGWAQAQDTPLNDVTRGFSNDIIGVAGQEVDGKTTVKFRKVYPPAIRDLDAPISITGQTDIIIALHSSSDDFGQKHTAKYQASVNFFSGGASVVTWDARNVHAVLMGLGWGVFVPVAILLAASFKHIGHLWYQLHTALQLCALALICAGFGIIVDYVENDFQQTDSLAKAHGWVGLLSVVAVLANPIIGFYANAVYQPDREAPPVWPDLVHAWIGRVGGALAIVAISSGFWVLDSNRGFLGLFFAWLAVLFALGVWMKLRHSKGSHMLASRSATELIKH
eukprot:TRINITY_DN15103_c0_g1_i1.p1 TRINITY_DN15103_c0_g1~~TRINITY_DN15103_c0_g1_i1.p1  ORF type:complete len:948 (+),score=173.48 TRINITY_DN15103_c0_g1_i1:222-2846(+)